jgi:hypothetical protein
MVGAYEDASKAWGRWNLEDVGGSASLWGFAWAMLAAAAGLLLAVVAATLVRRAGFIDSLEFDGGYNALAPLVDAALTKTT